MANRPAEEVIFDVRELPLKQAFDVLFVHNIALSLPLWFSVHVRS